MNSDSLPAAVHLELTSILSQEHFNNATLEYRIEKGRTSSPLCTVYEITVTDLCTARSIDFYVKLLPENQSQRHALENRIYFQNECNFYTKILRPCLELQYNPVQESQQSQQNVYFQGGAKCYRARCNDHIGFLIMENAKKLGYRTMDNTMTLSLNSATILMKEIGRLHALGLHYKSTNPSGFQSAISTIQETIFSGHLQQSFEQIIRFIAQDALQLIANTFPAQSVYHERLRAFTATMYQTLSELANGKSVDEKWYTVIHGDIWVNNLMFKYSDGAVRQAISVRLLDYQTCRYTSPLVDVVFVLLVSVGADVRDAEWRSLLRVYHASLWQLAHRLDTSPRDILPFDVVMGHFKTYGKFALGLALLLLPLYLDEGGAGGPIDGHQELENEVINTVIGAANRKTSKCKNRIIQCVTFAVDNEII